MKLQILNNTKYNLTNEKKGFIDYFKKNSVDFTTSEQSVSVPTSTFVYRYISGFNADTGKAQMVKQMKLNNSIRNDLRSFVDDSDIVIFVYEAGKQKPDEMITNWTEKNGIKNNTVFIQVVINDYLLTTGKFLLAVKHELMHALCFTTGARDEMDMAHNGIAFYNNSQPDNPDSNFGFTWNNLKPFLNKQSIIAKNFTNAVAQVLNFEGGYVNNPNDRGGETKYGISKKAYPDLDIKNLTKETATEIYYRDYWLASSCDRMDYKVALVVFDMSVNHGVSRSIKILQKTLKVKIDGIIGTQTLGALRTDAQFPRDILRERVHFYLNLSSSQLKEFGHGWMNRVFDLLNLIYIK
jgi:hypothetical protein